MTLRGDLLAKVSEYARSQWAPIPQGRVVPTEESLTHGNTGIHIDATVLYADIDGSTGMVDTMTNMMAADITKPTWSARPGSSRIMAAQSPLTMVTV